MSVGKKPSQVASLPPPDVIATEIAEDLAAALDQFAEIATKLSPNT